MRIGILFAEFKNLSNWQLRIIKAILDDPTLELVLVFGNDVTSNSQKTSSFRKVISKTSLGRLIIAFQVAIEKKVFFKEMFCVDREELQNALINLPKIEIGRIEAKNIDLVINLGFEPFSYGSIDSPKYGVWDMLHAESSATTTKPTGFSEVLQKKATIGFTLLRHASKTEVEIVDQAFFNRGWSMVETATISQEGGVSVVLKNLKRLQEGHSFDLKSEAIPKFKNPGVFAVLKYMVQFYAHLLKKIRQRLAYRLFGKRYECWSVFLGEGSFLERTQFKMQPLKMPADEFWADPFLFRHQGTDYVFFENYSYKTKRGKISCGKIKDQELHDIVDVLDFDYHLSFPFIFKENDEILLMPEASENKRLEIYKAVDFPEKWELYTTAFEDERVADAFFYDDEQNQKWLFINKQAAETSPMNSELFIYKVDSIKLDKLRPHTQNPVIIDARVARNGGPLFIHENMLYRPSQRNTDGIYGRALNVNRIIKLTLNEYLEENVQIFEPDFDKNLMATHHLHQTEDLFVFDAAYWSK